MRVRGRGRGQKAPGVGIDVKLVDEERMEEHKELEEEEMVLDYFIMDLAITLDIHMFAGKV